MAPSWVLLDRQVPFPHEPIRLSEGAELVGLQCPPSDEEMIKEIAEFLQTLNPVAQLNNPPILSSLRMLPPMNCIPPQCSGVTSARISSSDKHLVALYAGDYCPGTVSEGCYLIYNTCKNSLSPIPPIPFDHSHDPIGPDSAVVLSDVEGDGYVLAELIRVRGPVSTSVELYLWRSSSTKWVVKAGLLPSRICRPTYDFYADMCFLGSGSTLCCVDLFKGLVLCDLNPVLKLNSQPVFRFIQLPHQCVGNAGTSNGLRAEEFRSMAFVLGAYRFVTMDGYAGHQPGKKLELAVWTLTLSANPSWSKTSSYNLGNIWNNKTHQANGMPRVAPSFPVLSKDKHDVIYLVFTDVRVVSCKPEYKGQYLLRVDMSNNKVQFSQGSTEWIYSQFMASDFSAYQQGSVDHLREIEPSKLGASGKGLEASKLGASGKGIEATKLRASGKA